MLKEYKLILVLNILGERIIIETTKGSQTSIKQRTPVLTGAQKRKLTCLLAQSLHAESFTRSGTLPRLVPCCPKANGFGNSTPSNGRDESEFFPVQGPGSKVL